MRITTSAQGVAAMPAGTRSTDAGLSAFQRAQLRAQEQGAGAQLQPYGSLQPNSQTNQYRQALGAAPLTAQTSNGMTANGQAQAQPSNLLSGGMQSAVQPGMATLGQPNGMQPNAGAQPNGLPQAPGNPAAVSGMAPQQGMTGQQGAMQGTNQFGMTSAMPNFGGVISGQAPATGLTGAEQAYGGGLQGGMGAVNNALGMARGDVSGATQGANSTLNPFYQAGGQANNTQAAMSGALGNAAQGQAMSQFMNSPGQEYLVNESERAIRRNAAATGGLGGANVQRALQENAVGLAAQDFNNSFNRMGTISDRGLAAGGQISGNQMTGGNLLSGLAQNAGNLNANMMYGTGQNLAGGRTRAGEMIAGNIADSSSNLANIFAQSGAQQSGVIGQGGQNLANLLSGAGKDSATINAQIAQLLAQIGTSAGGQQAGVGNLGGTAQTEGILGRDNMTGLAMGAAFLSDGRLKKNVQKIGRISGANIYSWDWTGEGKSLAQGQPTVGVIAQEHLHASTTGDDGYLRVDYSRVF